ncbi:uncharacterized protein [Temnothorax longispinosus]|uniref:uncharacterized protein isoform X2 n=1 Tax=Temnothorax longispinosus TaxID=300112 RepID=UPI003A99AB4E
MASASQQLQNTQAKKRQAKATSEQIDYMVDYFTQHPHVATGKFKSLHGHDDLRGSWEQLVADLNQMAKGGKTKDVKSWKSTWRDNKTAVSQKVAKIRANRAATGNVGGPPLKLTEREIKILGIMGFDYVEGVQCPDAFPEEQAKAMELLAEGQEGILDDVPVVITTRDINDNTDLELIINPGITEGGINEALIYEASSQVVNLEIRESQDRELPTAESQVGESQAGEMQALESQARESQATLSRTCSRTQRSTYVPRGGRERLGTQLLNAREDFATLAERQVTCMEMFAKAMEKIAENERERNELLRTLVDNERAREQTYLELTSIIKDCVKTLRRE